MQKRRRPWPFAMRSCCTSNNLMFEEVAYLNIVALLCSQCSRNSSSSERLSKLVIQNLDGYRNTRARRYYLMDRGMRPLGYLNFLYERLLYHRDRISFSSWVDLHLYLHLRHCFHYSELGLHVLHDLL